MGSQVSKTSVDDVSSAVNNAVIQNVLNCPNYSNVNDISIDGNYNTVRDVTQQLTASINTNCFFRASNQQALQNTILDEITATAKANGSMLWGAVGGGLFTEANVDVDALSKAINKSTTQNIANCGNQLSKNGITIHGNWNTVTGVVQDMNISVVNGCLFSPSNMQSMANDVSSTIDASSTTGKGKPTIGGWVVYAVVAFIVLGLLFAGYKIYAQQKGKGGLGNVAEAAALA